MEIPVKVKSSNMELKSILFGDDDVVKMPQNAEIRYMDTDAEFGSFETEIVIDLVAAVNSTQAVELISRHLYDKLKDLDSAKVFVKGTNVDIDEQAFRRKLLSVYYKN